MANSRESESEPGQAGKQENDQTPPDYEVLLELEDGLCIARIGIDDLREQDINARTMTAQEFRQLTSNIENRSTSPVADRSTLESIPYCALTKKHVEIVSGHHRKRSAKTAGMEHLIILLDRSGLTRDQIRAKQLAHNSINGKDDPQIVKQIYELIKDAEAKIESFIDPADLEIPRPDSIPITDLLGSGMEHRTIMFTFLPHQLENFEDVVEAISKEIDMVGVSEIANFDKFKDTLREVKDIEDVRAVGMVISKMCDIVLAHYRDILEERVEEDDTEETED